MTRIFREHEKQYIDVTENYDYIKDIMYKYAKNKFRDGFIELHLAKGVFTNKPILIKLSNIGDFFDISND